MLISIYQCLCDRTRLRILNLLDGGELCVCHFQRILGEPQVKVSKHLAYLRRRGLVTSRREANWMIYRLADRPTPELKANLACLQDCVREDPRFRKDREKLRALRARGEISQGDCCPAVAAPKRTPKAARA
jgi:ArsR family transcriptional regulator